MSLFYVRKQIYQQSKESRKECVCKFQLFYKIFWTKNYKKVNATELLCAQTPKRTAIAPLAVPLWRKVCIKHAVSISLYWCNWSSASSNASSLSLVAVFFLLLLFFIQISVAFRSKKLFRAMFDPLVTHFIVRYFQRERNFSNFFFVFASRALKITWYLFTS